MTGALTVADLSGRTMNDMQLVRVFVGLKLAPEIARQLAALARPLGSYGVRLVPSADMHLTPVPPWNEPDVTSAAKRVRTAVDGVSDFSLTFVRLRYGPTLRHPHPGANIGGFGINRIIETVGAPCKLKMRTFRDGWFSWLIH
jgi:hypothetical protein